MKLKCPVCHSVNITHFFEKSNFPVLSNYPYKSYSGAQKSKSGNLKLCNCLDCSFVYNSLFDSTLLQYNENYDNTQDISIKFDNYLNKVISFITEKVGENKSILEIGCGKGNFLDKITTITKSNGYGFDPSYINYNEKCNNNIKFYNSYFDKNSQEIEADFIIMRHLIEHIDNPIDLLDTIDKKVKHNGNLKLFIETPSILWILENQVFFDFFYEHCSYFDKSSIEVLLNNAGYLVTDFSYEFGDQYMWIIAEKSNTPIQNSKNDQMISKITKQCYNLNKIIKLNTPKIKKNLDKMNEKGNIALWGAGAKGVTFLNLFDSAKKRIKFVVDINPRKQEKFIPKTGHPIVSSEILAKENITHIIVMNDNYKKEIIKTLESFNIINVSIVSAKDFIMEVL